MHLFTNGSGRAQKRQCKNVHTPSFSVMFTSFLAQVYQHDTEHYTAISYKIMFSSCSNASAYRHWNFLQLQANFHSKPVQTSTTLLPATTRNLKTT